MTKEEIQKNSEHWYNKYKDAEKENKTLEGCLLAEQEYTLVLEKENKGLKEQIEKMKDEEMAEKEYENCKEKIEHYCDKAIYVTGFLAGLKAGRPQWHDLRENPNDLPDDTYDVLDQAGYKVHYNFFQNVWVNEKDEIDKHVIAWCEIPTFDKE